MQPVEITRATVAGGKRVGVGDVVELADHHATELIAMGKAVPIVDRPVADNRDADVAKKTSRRTESFGQDKAPGRFDRKRAAKPKTKKA